MDNIVLDRRVKAARDSYIKRLNGIYESNLDKVCLIVNIVNKICKVTVFLVICIDFL